MSATANWSYTAKATIWRKQAGSNDEYGDPISGYAAPEAIMVDYEGGLSKRIASIGEEIVVKNTVWSEYSLAAAGDYLLIGECSGSQKARTRSKKDATPCCVASYVNYWPECSDLGYG